MIGTGNEHPAERNGQTNGDEPARVVLVGRTGLEAVLRRQPGITLLRPRAPFDAIGEIAEGAAPGDGIRTIVLTQPESLASDRVENFASAVRRLDAQAQILAIADAPVHGFDGFVPASTNASEVLFRLNNPFTAQVAASAAVPVQEQRARPVSPVVAAPVAQTSVPAIATPDPFTPAHEAAVSSAAIATEISVHDHTPLGAMLAGADPVQTALANIRTLLGRDIAFIPAGSETPENASAGVLVSHHGRVMGRLIAENVPAEMLQREASWLAGWVVLAQQQEQLRRAAFTDELTGAWNRRYFQRFLAAAIEQAQAERRTVTVLVFDIDNFKSYNDRFGHAAGDEILMQSVKLLTSVIRPTDRVCRIGGDEFVVIFHDPEGPRNPASPLSGKGPSSVADIARRFQKQICEHRFPKLLEQAPGTLTISGGMATYPWDGMTADELLERADCLALQSKRQGKNAITLGQGAVRACELENT